MRYLASISLVIITAFMTFGAPSVFANGFPGFVSTEPLCTTGRGEAAHSTLVSAKVCGESGADSFCFDPLEYYGNRGGVQSAGIQCAEFTAITNSAIALICGFIGPGIEDNIITNIADLKGETTSIALTNGNIQHQWQVFCPIVGYVPN